jgi:hypothetical protein
MTEQIEQDTPEPTKECFCGDNYKTARRVVWSLVAMLACLSIWTGVVQREAAEEGKSVRLKEVSQRTIHTHEKKVIRP